MLSLWKIRLMVNLLFYITISNVNYTIQGTGARNVQEYGTKEVFVKEVILLIFIRIQYLIVQCF